MNFVHENRTGYPHISLDIFIFGSQNFARNLFYFVSNVRTIKTAITSRDHHDLVFQRRQLHVTSSLFPLYSLYLAEFLSLKTGAKNKAKTTMY